MDDDNDDDDDDDLPFLSKVEAEDAFFFFYVEGNLAWSS